MQALCVVTASCDHIEGIGWLLITRQPGRYLFQDTKTDGAPAVQKTTQEYIHPVVAHAWSDPNPAKDSYKAKSPDSFLGGALYGFNREEAKGQKGFVYRQKEKVSKSFSSPLIIDMRVE